MPGSIGCTSAFGDPAHLFCGRGGKDRAVRVADRTSDMGYDYASRQLFCRGADLSTCRQDAVRLIRGTLLESGYREVAREDEADRSLVVGPPGRWLFIGDTAGTTRTHDWDAFHALTAALSTSSPVAEIEMSDTCVLHLTLYRSGEKVDTFGTGIFPWWLFESEEQAAEYAGHPEQWEDLLPPEASVDALRAAWAVRTPPGDVTEILDTTAALFGWDPELIEVGYTRGGEGIPIRYDQFLDLPDEERIAFTELHFHARQGSSQ